MIRELAAGFPRLLGRWMSVAMAVAMAPRVLMSVPVADARDNWLGGQKPEGGLEC